MGTLARAAISVSLTLGVFALVPFILPTDTYKTVLQPANPVVGTTPVTPQPRLPSAGPPTRGVAGQKTTDSPPAYLFRWRDPGSGTIHVTSVLPRDGFGARRPAIEVYPLPSAILAHANPDPQAPARASPVNVWRKLLASNGADDIWVQVDRTIEQLAVRNELMESLMRQL